MESVREKAVIENLIVELKNRKHSVGFEHESATKRIIAAQTVDEAMLCVATCLLPFQV